MCTPRSKYDKNHIIKKVKPLKIKQALWEKTHKTGYTERADHILKVFYLLPLPLPNRPNLASHWKTRIIIHAYYIRNLCCLTFTKSHWTFLARKKSRHPINPGQTKAYVELNNFKGTSYIFRQPSWNLKTFALSQTFK